MNLELFFVKLPFFVKLIPVCLLSIMSFFILDLMVWFDIVEGGLNPIVFILFIITRAGFAYLVSRLVLGTQESDSFELRRDFITAIIVFGVPVFSFTEVLRILFGIVIKLPPPYVSLMQSTIISALLYEFPRLIQLIVIKRSLYGKIQWRE